MSTNQERTWLEYPAEPGRRIGVRVERSVKTEGAAPVIVLCHGTDDATVPWEAAERLAAQAPNGSSLVLEGANHSFGATHPMGDVIPSTLEAAVLATEAHVRELLAGRT